MDSIAKMRPGFLSGEYGDFGKWDECIEVNYDENNLRFKGEYCMYELHWPQVGIRLCRQARFRT